MGENCGWGGVEVGEVGVDCEGVEWWRRWRVMGEGGGGVKEHLVRVE